MNTIEKATIALYAGEVIAYPTEAVWGLGCSPFDEVAVAKIFELKNRPPNKGMIVLVHNWVQVMAFGFRFQVPDAV